MKRSPRVDVSNRKSPNTHVSSPKGKSENTLLGWEDLMEWQRDNEYVLTGYRRASYSIPLSVKSILKLHNETINIWSHLLGGGLFLALVPYFCLQFVPHYRHTTHIDGLALIIFFSGVTICFALSSIKEGHRLGNQLDHLGIVIVIWASAIPSDYFGFYCDLKLKYIYWTLATLAAFISAVFTIRPVFRTPAYRPFRSAIYGLLGLSIFIPAIHGVILHGWAVQNERMSLTYFMGLGLLNGLGTAIYAARIPERWYPRRFDIYGASHQIMHILVICGALSHTTGLLKAFDYWQRLQAQEGGACRASKS